MDHRKFALLTLLGGVCLTSCRYVPEQAFMGYPDREGKIDVRRHFSEPPRGYGNVPFYWWNGDSLKTERLKEQLDILADASTDGFAVSYIHTHPQVDKEVNALGYGSFGRADGGEPGVFSEEWWKVWDWFSAECADRGMGLGLDDYVIGWAKNGYYVDEICRDTAFANYQGRLKMEGKWKVESGGVLDVEVKGRLVSVVAYPLQKNLMGHVKDGRLRWACDADEPQTVYAISTSAAYELHPEYGERLVDTYFGRFEEKLSKEGQKGMNYFFQDELHYDLNIHSWCEDMAEEFMKRKGYDVRLFLPALFENVGSVTPKVRLDYSDVVVSLSEERYFKPVFDWHKERSLIYGCDNNGRGLNPVEYLDYFRSISWFTAPGNDAPARGSSFRQTKVSSSAAHLYERPRTWLEAFHSMGWDSNGRWLTSQLDHHLIAGGNLLCLHGLYYSTHGGWWEWAPPCFHFRMPYWPHMKHWLKYAERMCFLLSQGRHVCDVAVLYPAETLQAYPGTSIDALWNFADRLTNSGLDYDFIDFQSLQKAKVGNGSLSVAGEEYKVVVLAGVKAMHHATLKKIEEFGSRGGIVIASDTVGWATDRVGEGDEEVAALRDKIFSSGANALVTGSADNAVAYIKDRIVEDFIPAGGSGKVLHRTIGGDDVYMVMDVEKGSELFFRAKGKVEVWNAQDGGRSECRVLRQTADGTWLKFDGETGTSRLYVFTDGEPVMLLEEDAELMASDTLKVEGDWTMEIVPTMNNKWGDYRLPASDEIIGVEAREFAYATVIDGQVPDFSSSAVGIYGYAPYFEVKTVGAGVDLRSAVLDNDGWAPYVFSWQYGVLDNPGSQGYHGLKGKVDNRFLILDRGGDMMFRTYVYTPTSDTCRIEIEGRRPDFMLVDDKEVDADLVSLGEGWHRIHVVYSNTKKSDYSIFHNQSNYVDFRERSAVMFYPLHAPKAEDRSPYDNVVAMKWWNTDFLKCDIHGPQQTLWAYKFATAPGMRTMTMDVDGEILSLHLDGQKLEPKKREGGAYVYSLGEDAERVGEVVAIARTRIGSPATSFFRQPVKIACGRGKAPAGDWSRLGAMKHYSGGVRYVKEVYVDNCENGKYVLHLGEVDATCQVKVNGTDHGILMSPPYTVDISKSVRRGSTNRIEVLVYSTLANHYRTVPSAYRGNTRSGLVGPVSVVVY